MVLGLSKRLGMSIGMKVKDKNKKYDILKTDIDNHIKIWIRGEKDEK